MLNETLKEIFFGDDDEWQVTEYNREEIFKKFKDYIDFFSLMYIIPQIFCILNRNQEDREKRQENEEDEDDDDESDDNNMNQLQQTFQINEPNLHDIQAQSTSITNINEFLQQNPKKRTFLRAIAEVEGFINYNYNTRSSIPGKQNFYNIYAFSDLRYAPTMRVKKIFNRIIENVIHKQTKKKVNRYSREYFHSLLQQFQVMNQQQIESSFNQNKVIDQIELQLKQKKSEKELEKALSKYVKLQNETKENFLIVSSEKKHFNYYEFVHQNQQNFKNPLNSADFYKDIEQIIKKRKVILQSDVNQYQIDFNQQQQNNHNYDGVYNEQDEYDQGKQNRIDNQIIEQFFQNQSNFQNQPKLWGQIKQSQIPTSNKPFSFEQEIQQPGFQLYTKIRQQQEAERKYNEQMKDKNEVDDQRKSKTIASKQDIMLYENKKEKSQLSKMEVEFQYQLDNYSYFNDEIINFCMGNTDNFLTRPISYYNRIEIDLNDPAFFSEKLSMVLHLQKTQIQQQNNRSFKEQLSILSKPNDQNSLLSRPDFASKNANDQGSEDSDRQSESSFQNQYQDSQLPQNDNQLKHEIQIQIQGHQKKKNQQAILNSSVAENFELNNFSQKVEDHRDYHRSNFMQIYLNTERGYFSSPTCWKVIAMKNQGKQVYTNTGSTIFDVIPEQLNCQEQFKTVDSLSLTKSKSNFVLFEYVEQRPLVMNNTGMRIKLQRCVYENRALDQFFNSKEYLNRETEELNASITIFKQMIIDKLGKFGQIQFLQKSDTLPLQGQIIDENIVGVAIMENDLFRAPIFQQKLPDTDFLLIRKLEIDQNGNRQYIYRLRQIDYIYLVGQIEPKMEIYTPHSRSLGTFSKNCLKTYIKQRFQQDQGKVQFKDLQEVFYKQSEQNIRNALKDCQATQDLNNQGQWLYTQIDNSSEKNRGIMQYDIHAKQVCLYESMLNSSYMLEKFGLETLKNSDKMKKTLQVYLKKNPSNYEGWVVARRIEDVIPHYTLIYQELNMTSWSLSTSFSHSANQTGRMMLYGFGDPTNGHGGLSYVKKPLKARGEKETQIQAEKRPTIMGTDQDLRKLHVIEIKDILIKLGVPVKKSISFQQNFQSDQLARLKRWKMIERIKQLLKQQNNYDSEDFEAVEFRKRIEQLTEEEKHQLEVIKNFAKNQRQTTKMQKDQYQKELNNQLWLQIYNLSLTCPGNTISDFAEIKNLRKRKQLQNDDKLKDLEFTENEIKKNIISTYENYMLNLQAYIEKEKKIWLEKKRKKNLL